MGIQLIHLLLHIYVVKIIIVFIILPPNTCLFDSNLIILEVEEDLKFDIILVSIIF